MTGPIFTVKHQCPSSGARTGELRLGRGNVATPVFMPVGTNGTVKALANEDLREIGFEIILSNTYHLYLRPGTAVMEKAGGLHRFMNWDRNILTDSGGFQIFSLAQFRKITPEGVQFRSHIDGSGHMLSPESVVEIQRILGSDIQMQLDVCTPWGTEKKKVREALAITSSWLERAKKAWDRTREGGYRGELFAILQGNFYRDLREESATALVGADTPGVAIGGLSVGEPAEVFREFLAFSASLLPIEKPRYVMGIGTPEYILEAIEQGIDMFDCVFPTRTGRNGRVFTHKGPFALKKAENTFDMGPIDTECGCKVCRLYSRSYLRHLFKTREILCSMLASYHNLYFLHDLVKKAGEAINRDRFADFKKEFLSRYEEGHE
ncbi:MAG: tRNA guanosine(34) transglycosylase Tgt [Spirochaetaceae bacterium]|jgi:queuine tRNA-ribosyltransferase|nr:tRNA guanosine(34) transglycosylase Tgt [Spirochaetaceae bacterium]